MPRLLRVTLLSLRDLVATAGPFVIVTLVLLAGAYYLLTPAPPRHVVLATGPEDSAYADFGKRYAQALKRYGITVTLRTTRGSYDNLHLLRGMIGRPGAGILQMNGQPTAQNTRETGADADAERDSGQCTAAAC